MPASRRVVAAAVSTSSLRCALSALAHASRSSEPPQRPHCAAIHTPQAQQRERTMQSRAERRCDPHDDAAQRRDARLRCSLSLRSVPRCQPCSRSIPLPPLLLLLVQSLALPSLLLLLSSPSPRHHESRVGRRQREHAAGGTREARCCACTGCSSRCSRCLVSSSCRRSRRSCIRCPRCCCSSASRFCCLCLLFACALFC